MNKKIVILISGKKGTGKTYIADEILKFFSNNSIKMSFAEPLKEISNRLINELLYKYKEDINTPEGKEKIRPIYQAVGSVARSFDKDYWAEQLYQKINQLDINIKMVVVDDSRYFNEHNYFNDHYVIRIKSIRESTIPGIDNDISERGLDSVKDSEYDFLIRDINNSLQWLPVMSKICKKLLEQKKETQ